VRQASLGGYECEKRDCYQRSYQAIGEIDPGGSHSGADLAEAKRARWDVLQLQHVGGPHARHAIALIRLSLGLGVMHGKGLVERKPA
jgi:hypothetical protein